MFKSIIRLLTSVSDPVERLASSGFATATTPDDLIAESVRTLIVNDFEAWTREPPFHSINYYDTDLLFKEDARKKKIESEIGFYPSIKTSVFRHKGKGITFAYDVSDDVIYKNASVNGVAISIKAAEKARGAYIEIDQAVSIAKAKADRIKAEMKAEKKKWDLAEKLLGMKRLENGALVPVSE